MRGHEVSVQKRLVPSYLLITGAKVPEFVERIL